MHIYIYIYIYIEVNLLILKLSSVHEAMLFSLNENNTCVKKFYLNFFWKIIKSL